MARSRQTATKTTGAKIPRSSLFYRGKLAEVAEAAGHGTTLPEPKDGIAINFPLSHESTFYSKYFPLGPPAVEDFEPRLEGAIFIDPLTGIQERWLAVLLASKYDGDAAAANHDRPPLNLVVCIDSSESMGELMPTGGDHQPKKTKLQAAKDALMLITTHMKPGDKLAVVSFNDIPAIVVPSKAWTEFSTANLVSATASLIPSGGTNMSSVMEFSAQMLGTDAGMSSRIVILTDITPAEQTSVIPPAEQSDGDSFAQLVQSNLASKAISTTVISLGCDMHPEIIAAVSRNPGCNYAGLATSKDLDSLITEEFPMIVSPVAFNVQITLDKPFLLLEGYGNPEAATLRPDGVPVQFATEFPSLKNARGETRGGVVVFRVQDTGTLVEGETAAPASQPAMAKITWITPTGTTVNKSAKVDFTEPTIMPSAAIRKAVLMVQYTRYVKEYLDLRPMETDDQATLERFIALGKCFPGMSSIFLREFLDIGDDDLLEDIRTMVEIAKDDDINLAEVEASLRKRRAGSPPTEEPPAQFPSVPAPPLPSSAPEQLAPAPQVAPNATTTYPQGQTVMQQAPVCPPSTGKRVKLRDEILSKADRRTLQEFAKLAGIPANMRTSDLMDKLQNEFTPTSDCYVCMMSPKAVLLWPCRHVCVCKTCALTIKECPLCHQKVDFYVDIFQSP